MAGTDWDGPNTVRKDKLRGEAGEMRQAPTPASLVNHLGTTLSDRGSLGLRLSDPTPHPQHLYQG